MYSMKSKSIFLDLASYNIDKIDSGTPNKSNTKESSPKNLALNAANSLANKFVNEIKEFF